MPVINVKCKNTACNTPVISNSDKWGTEKNFITIICPKCKQPIEKRANPNFVKKDKTELLHSEGARKPQISEDEVAGWLIDKAAKKYYHIKRKKQTLGRSSSMKVSDVSIDTPDLTVSGAHCIIDVKLTTEEELEYTIADNKSKNGVLINGLKKLEIDEILFLKDEDVLQMGNSEFIFFSIFKMQNPEQIASWIERKLK